MRSDNVYELPPDLPVPPDDGACDHLPGLKLPRLALASTAGRVVDLGPTNATIHKVNECIRLDEVEQLPKIYRQILVELLVSGKR